MKAKDARTKYSHEIFSSIKFIKANAFEEYFKEKLFKLREKEINLINVKNIISGFFIFTFLWTP